VLSLLSETQAGASPLLDFRSFVQQLSGIDFWFLKKLDVSMEDPLHSLAPNTARNTDAVSESGS
jgi:hypothetical protein